MYNIIDGPYVCVCVLVKCIIDGCYFWKLSLADEDAGKNVYVVHTHFHLLDFFRFSVKSELKSERWKSLSWHFYMHLVSIKLELSHKNSALIPLHFCNTNSAAFHP